MSRLDRCFADAADQGRAALVIYLTAGDPSPEKTVAVVEAVVEAGANAASQVGELVASHIIPRPADGVVAAYLS